MYGDHGKASLLCMDTFKGVPLQGWREETFSLLGDCVGSSVKVDPGTVRKEMLLFGGLKSCRRC